MIILNIDLGKELEKEFYARIKDKNITYLEYVEELIKKDLQSYAKKNAVKKNSKKDGNLVHL